MPRHLAEKILAGRDALQGERKQITVLFADIVGSTELIRDRDPEEAQRLLDGAVQRMMTAVHRYEGTVSRLMGDGLMAMFGAPVAHEDHAVRACYAALAMLATLRGYADQVRQAHGANIQIRVGLNSGEVIVRLIADDLHMDYTAMGQTVHLAARMEGLASAGTVLLTPTTLELVAGLVDVRPLGPTPVKGLEQPLDVYELVRTGVVRTRLQASAARGLTPFVGRDDERAVLDRALARAGAGHGQVVALVGEPGVGKSRLVHEVTSTAGAAGWLVLQVGGLSYGTASSYLPIVELMKQSCRIEPGDSVDTVRERVTSRLLSLDPSLAFGLSPLLALLDVPVEDAAWAALDPPRRRRQTLDVVKRVLLRGSQDQPLLLVVEDLHWIDSESQALLDEFVDSVSAARLLLLVNYRPEYRHGWGNKSAYSQVRVDPLETSGSAQLLRSLLGDDAALDPLKVHLIQHTEGNPFFLEESVHTLVETGALAGERGAYLLTGSVESIRVPATVQAVLAARIDRLTPAEKHLLQTAAVIGKDVPFRLLQAIAEMTEGDLQRDLSHLQAADLLYPSRQYPEPEYTFKHALTHEVAYGGLLQERRKTLHSSIMAAFERLYPDRLDEHAERLAHHATQAEWWAPAADYSIVAGRRAARRSAGNQAIGHFEQALTALERLPRTAELTEREIDLRFDLRTAYWSLDDYEHSYVHLRSAEALAESVGDVRRQCRALAYLANHLKATDDLRHAVEAGERAIELATELDDLVQRVTATDTVGYCYAEMGELERALALFRQNLAALRAVNPGDLLGWHRNPTAATFAMMSWCLAWQGAFPEAVDCHNAALRLAEASDHPASIEFACNAGGVVYALMGDPSRAIAVFERGFAIMRDLGRPPLPIGFGFLGHALVLAGRTEEALDCFEQWQQEAPPVRIYVTLITAWRAGAYLQAGRIDDSERLAVQAARMGRAQHERGYEAQALRQLGDVIASSTNPDVERASRSYREALGIAEELGMCPIQAHCHLGLGKLYRRTGRTDEARAELATAVVMLRELGMSFWLPEAEAELAQAVTSPAVDEVSR